MSDAQSAAVLLSIQSEHAHRIYLGDKKAELRKSFSPSARLVFLYETAPVSAVTGAFVVREAKKTSIKDAIEIARHQGVSGDRAKKYYGDRAYGWIVGVAAAIKFRDPLPLAKLREENHLFSAPQVFTYLRRHESLTQRLLSVFLAEVAPEIELKAMPSNGTETLSNLIRSEVSPFYEDINEDFVRQVLEIERGSESAFSTVQKHSLEVSWRKTTLGYTVLTEKEHGAWKSGPTILLPEYRGLVFGVALRTAIENFCRARSGKSIYCTCSDARSEVVAYLLNAGMKFQARLVGHLARDRDELVFSKKLTRAPLRAKRTSISRIDTTAVPKIISRVMSSDPALRRYLKYLYDYLPNWYFKPGKGIRTAIFNGLQSYERGVRDYSAKGRILYVARSSNGRTLGALLGTMKRSAMIKINFVASKDNAKVAAALVDRALKDFQDCRRMYLTVGANRLSTISAINSQGFVLEGILQDPFSTGVDHLCFGIVRDQTGRTSLAVKNEEPLGSQRALQLS